MKEIDEENIYLWYQKHKKSDIGAGQEKWLQVLKNKFKIQQDAKIIENHQEVPDYLNTSININGDVSIFRDNSSAFFNLLNNKNFNSVTPKLGQSKWLTKLPLPVSENKSSAIALSLGVQLNESVVSWASLLTPSATLKAENLSKEKDSTILKFNSDSPVKHTKKVLVLDAEDANKMADMDVVGPQNADDQAFEISAIGDTKDKCTSAEDNQEDLSMLEAFPHNPVLPLYSSTPIVEKNMRAQILSRNLVRGEDGELFAANKMDEQQTMPSFQDDSIQPEEVRSPSSPRPRSLTTEKQRCDESQAWTSINARSPVDDVPSGKTGLNGSKLLGKRKSKKFIYPSANERSSSPQTINMSSLSHSFSKASQPINKEFKTNEEIDTVSHPIHSLLFTCGNNDLPLIKTSIKPQSDFKSLSNLTSKNDTSNTLGHDTKEHSCLEKSSKNAELTSVSNHDKLKSENDKEMNKNEVALSRFKKDYFEDTEFVGFRSASGKRIAISDEALVKGRTLWDNANENVSENSTAELNHQENDAENNYQNVLNESRDKAFSDNVVEYSSKDCTNLPIKSLQEDIEYENKERMELAGKSPEDFTKTDQSRESFTKTNQSHEESMKIANEFPSFKTASNKQIDIKPELLVKARNLWHQIETCESEIKEVPRATFGSVKSKELLDPKHEGLKESPRSDISPILGSQKFKRKGNKLSLQNPSKPLLSEHPKSLSFSFPSEKRKLSLGSSRKFRKHSQSLNHPEMKERRERSPTCGQALAISEKRCDSQEKMEINDITEAFLLDLSWDNVLNERQSLNKNRQI